jgi:hypothetical protein
MFDRAKEKRPSKLWEARWEEVEESGSAEMSEAMNFG